MSILVCREAKLGIFREDIFRLHQIGTVVIINEFPEMVDNDFITGAIMGCGQAHFGMAKTTHATFVLACWLTRWHDRDREVTSFLHREQIRINETDLVDAIRIQPGVYKRENQQEK